MQLAHDKLATVFPNLSFRGFLMDINGKCIELTVQEKEQGSMWNPKRSPLPNVQVEITSMKSFKCNCN